MTKAKSNESLRLRAGELVEVRSREEILATLDADARLDSLPFMPEMFQYCGKRFQVYKSAHKTCDTVFTYRSRRMANAVHLETRCDGAAHGGCQAGCLMFWKEAWLKRVNTSSNGSVSSATAAETVFKKSDDQNQLTEADVWNATKAHTGDGQDQTYSCQATQLPYATTDLHWRELDQYIEDYRSGNVGILTILKGMFYKICYRLKNKGVGIRWLYDRVLPVLGGTPWPLRTGSIPTDQPTPTAILNLQPGELVRVKSYEQILRTVNTKNLNRGMTFDKEMVPYCGGVYRVLRRVNKIINEKTGRMQEMKNACIVLDSVICQSRFSECRLFCPRSIYPYWREIWLERLPASTAAVPQPIVFPAVKRNGHEVPEVAWPHPSGSLSDQTKPSEAVQQ